MLDGIVVSVALPEIGDHVGLRGAELQWVITAYTLQLGAFLLVGGHAADLLGGAACWWRACAPSGRARCSRASRAPRSRCSPAAPSPASAPPAPFRPRSPSRPR
jgi:MFS family permease